jgi:hypothetical protein
VRSSGRSRLGPRSSWSGRPRSDLFEAVEPPLETLEGGGDLRESLFRSPVDGRTMSGRAPPRQSF